MIINISDVQNGTVFDVTEHGETTTYTFQDCEDGEHEMFANVLRVILDSHGPLDGRYNKYRIYIRVQHGDKYECPDAPCKYCLD